MTRNDPGVGDIVRIKVPVTDGAWMFPTTIIPAGATGMVLHAPWMDRWTVVFAVGPGQFHKARMDKGDVELFNPAAWTGTP